MQVRLSYRAGHPARKLLREPLKTPLFSLRRSLVCEVFGGFLERIRAGRPRSIGFREASAKK